MHKCNVNVNSHIHSYSPSVAVLLLHTQSLLFWRLLQLIVLLYVRSTFESLKHLLSSPELRRFSPEQTTVTFNLYYTDNYSASGARSSDRDRGRQINKEGAEKDGKRRKEEKAVTCFLNRLCHHSASAVCSSSFQSFLIYWRLMLGPGEPVVNRASVPPCSGKPPPHFASEQKGAQKTNEEKVNVFHQSYLPWETSHRRTHSIGVHCVLVLWDKTPTPLSCFIKHLEDNFNELKLANWLTFYLIAFNAQGTRCF